MIPNLIDICKGRHEELTTADAELRDFPEKNGLIVSDTHLKTRN